MATKRKATTPRRKSADTTKLPTEKEEEISSTQSPAEASEGDVEGGFAEAPDTEADVETIHDEDTSTGRHVDSIEKI